MALVLKALRLSVLLPSDRTGLIAEVVAVMEGKPRGNPDLRVRFEPSRIERHCLASAYEQVAPIRRRVPMSSETRFRIVRAQPLQRVGGVEK